MARRVSPSHLQKPSLAWAIICKDGERSLPTLLDSIAPVARQIVIALDDRTSDRTARIARKYGAEVHPFTMCETHACARHNPPIQAQHFARARNFAHSKLDLDLDFVGWIDGDDQLINGQLLPDLLAKVPTGAIGVWAEYVYAYATRPDGSIAPNTSFHRERIFRTKVDGIAPRWEWKYRVHEVCAPEGLPPGYQARWILNNDVKWLHQAGAHKTNESAPRNLTLLEIDYEENPTDSRTLFYLGNQYFAMGQWKEAAFWYEKLLEVGTNPYENWQAQLYACKAFQRLGYLDHALRMAYGTLNTMPQHHEGYYALAETYSLMEEDAKVEYWSKAVEQLAASGLVTNPPFFVFRNPADNDFNRFMPIADAYQRQGRITEAREQLEKAYANFPDERVKVAIDGHRKTETDMETANSFVRMAEVTRDPAIITDLYRRLPLSVKSFGRVRDLAVPAMLAERQGVLNGAAS